MFRSLRNPFTSKRYTKIQEDTSSRLHRRIPLLVLLAASTAIILSINYFPTPTYISWIQGYQTEWLPDVPSIWDYLEIAKIDGRIPPRRPSYGALKSVGAKASIRTNLRDDRRYITSFVYAGWNNEVMSIFNLIYLSVLSKRFPILPSFTADPGHLGYLSFDVAISEIFDLSRLSALIDSPIVEMHELKMTADQPSRLHIAIYDGEHSQLDENGEELSLGDVIFPEVPERDVLGGWSWEENIHGSPPGSDRPGDLMIEWSPLPIEVYNSEHDFWKPGFLQLGQLLERTHTTLPESSLDLIKNYSIPVPKMIPDDQIAILDGSYFMLEQFDRWDLHGEYRAGQGVWNRIGKHMRWQPGLERVRDGYLRKLFGLRRSGQIPPYMAVHIRRTDFGKEWLDMPQRIYAYATWLILQSIRTHLGLTIKHIVVATDETDPEWLDGLNEYGWYLVNHTESRTVEKFGHWFPTIIDSTILSGGTGFLGAVSSTMSILAYRRTIDWNNGVGRFVDPNLQVPDDWVWEWP